MFVIRKIAVKQHFEEGYRYNTRQQLVASESFRHQGLSSKITTGELLMVMQLAKTSIRWHSIFWI